MEWLLITLGIIVVLFIALLGKSKKRTGRDGFPYQAAGTLFTPAERSFLGVLDKVVAGRARVFGKVRVGDVLIPKRGLQRGPATVARNKIDRKHFDYVLCSPDDLSVICVVELDDKSHQSKSRIARDGFLIEACKAAGIPMIQVPAKAGYTMSAISSLFSDILPQPLTAESSLTPSAPVTPKTPATACPKCSSKLVIKKLKSGANSGKQILACSAFPKCKHYTPIKNEAFTNPLKEDQLNLS
jgi:DNA-directed RNA polymerase subunit RPC12/RpoP